jgi:hypothetical protein
MPAQRAHSHSRQRKNEILQALTRQPSDSLYVPCTALKNSLLSGIRNFHVSCGTIGEKCDADLAGSAISREFPAKFPEAGNLDLRPVRVRLPLPPNPSTNPLKWLALSGEPCPPPTTVLAGRDTTVKVRGQLPSRRGFDCCTASGPGVQADSCGAPPARVPRSIRAPGATSSPGFCFSMVDGTSGMGGRVQTVPPANRAAASAVRTKSERLRAFILSMMRARWISMVRGEMPSS